MEFPKVLVAGPIYEGLDYCLEEFITAVQSLDYPNYDFLLVDNSKTNSFAKKIKKEYGVHTIYLPLKHMKNMQKVVRSRNKIFSYAIEKRYDYVFMLDSDVIVPKNSLTRLLAYHKDIISGLYFGRFTVDGGQKIMPVAWNYLTEEEFENVKDELVGDYVHSREDIRRHLTKEEIESGKIQEVIIPSGGCMLISRNVFKKISYGLLDVPETLHTGDDIFFCQKAREAGFTLYVDPTIICEHRTEGKFVKKGNEWVHPIKE